MGERKRSSRSSGRVARHGYALVTITARDANGFVHRYDEIETSVGALHEAVAIMQLKSTAMEASHEELRQA
jgi:hypothetical protein|nr:hypothetical protein [Microbacterium lemovicicum]